jgi:hypothetical protein
MSVHLRSFKKAMLALVTMMMSFAPAFFFYRVVLGYSEMGILNFVR